MFKRGELCYEICQHLSLYGRPGSIFYAEPAKLNGPLDHSYYCLKLVHCFLNVLICHDYDRVCLKVWMKFSGHHY